MRTTFVISAFAIIKDATNRVLLVLRNDHAIRNLPGGGVEHGESPWQAVIREVKEETGLEVVVTSLAGVYAKEHKDEIAFSFVCTVVGGQLTLNEEAKALEYFNLHEIPRNTIPKQVERIHDFFEDEQAIVMKIQTGKSAIELLQEGKL